MANLINFGIVPLLFADEADYDKVEQGDSLSIPNLREAVANGDTIVVRNETQNVDIPMQADFTDRQRIIGLRIGDAEFEEL